MIPCLRKGLCVRIVLELVVEHFGDFELILNALIEDEFEVRRVSGVDPLGDLRLEESRGGLETFQAEFLFLFVAHNGDVNLGGAHISGNFDVQDGHIADAGVLDFGQNRHTDDLPNGLTGLECSTGHNDRGNKSYGNDLAGTPILTVFEITNEAVIFTVLTVGITDSSF